MTCPAAAVLPSPFQGEGPGVRVRAAIAVLVFAVLVTPCPASAGPVPTAADLLRLALRNSTAPYVGRQRTEVYMESGRSTSVVRVESDGPERVRREFETGAAAGTVTLQSGHAQWMRGADGKWARLPDAIGEPDPAATSAAILRNYEVTVGATARIAGRKAVQVRIERRQKFDPSREVWVDPATGIVLKDVLKAPDGRLRSTTEFTEIALEAPPASRFEAPSEAAPRSQFGPSSFAPRATRAAVESESGRPVLLPTHVPAGYRVVMYGIMQTGSGRLMPAVRYSNGMSAFTIFQRGMGGPGMGGPGMGGPGRGRGWRGGRGPAEGQPSCVGQSTVQTSVVSVAAARSNYLLVGDLAEEELMTVARSLP